MSTPRPYSKYTCDAAKLLGRNIKFARKERRWSEHELAGRAAISRATLQRIEKGDPSCSIGLAFEVAAIVGLKLFDADNDTLKTELSRTDKLIALLPKRIHLDHQAVDDDF